MQRTSAAEIVVDRATTRCPGRDQPAGDTLSSTIPAGEFCAGRSSVQGGVPDRILAHPADDAVTRSAGGRGRRRLALGRLEELGLATADGDAPGGPRLPGSATLRALLSPATAEGAGRLLGDGEGRARGRISVAPVGRVRAPL